MPAEANGPKGLTAARIIVIIAGVLLGGAYLSSYFPSDTVAPTEAEAWTRYNFSKHGFSIAFPSDPLQSSSTFETPLNEEVQIEKFQTSTQNGETYGVQVLTFPKDNTTGYDEFIRSIVEEHFADVTRTTFDGHQAAYFLWDKNVGGTKLKAKGLVVSVENTVYFVYASDAQFKTFLDSFTLLES